MHETEEYKKNKEELEKFQKDLSDSGFDLSRLIDKKRKSFKRWLMKQKVGRPLFRNLFEGLVDAVLDDVFVTHPASVHKHHNRFFGLADHTQEVIDFALSNLRTGEKGESHQFNCTVAIIGGLFHDSMKTSEYSVRYSPVMVTGKTLASGGGDPDVVIEQMANDHMNTDYSAFSKEIGHVSGGAIAFNVLWKKIFGNSEPEIGRAVTHVLLSHHMLREWGSPVSPQSKAAWAVHLADQASVNINEEKFLKTNSHGK